MGCVSAAFATPKWQELDGYTFDKYVSDFGFGFGFASQARKNTFEQNLKKIQLHNLEPSTYKENVNRFTALTEDEMNAFKGYNRAQARSMKSDWTVATPTPVANGTYPTSLDWRSKGAVTKIKNQGGCGSCWAFASTETIESHVQIASGKLLELSPQQITACTPNPDQCGGKGGCSGATAELAFDYISKNGGIATAKDYPYTAGKNGHVLGGCKKKPSIATVTGHVKNKENDLDSLMAAVQLGPVAISVDAIHGFEAYTSGIFDGCKKDAVLDHNVQLVGYGEEKGNQYWIVRNSWGDTWGESGYIRLKRFNSSDAHCGTDSKPSDGSSCKNGPKQVKVCGMCGILYDTCYPIGAKLVNEEEATL